MTRRVTLGVVVLLACLSGASDALTDDTRAVPLALVVTDARGQAVRNLTPADLEITEAGEKRAVASIALRGPSPRVIGLLLDEFHVAAGESSDRARSAALAFVDHYLRPDDTVYVMKPLDPQTSIKPAASLAEVRERILSFSGRKDDFSPRGAFEKEYMSASGGMAVRQRAQVMRAGLEALAIAMREPDDAAKALVVLTEGFAPEERNRYRLMTIRTTARAASLANLPIYIADPSGHPDGDGRFDEQWRSLASQTGGALLTATPDLRASLARVGADLGAQYLVRFESSGKQDGRFHGLDLKPRRAGVVVRGPSGYWAPFAPLPVDTSRPRVDYSTLLTPHVSGLIQPWFRMAPAENGRTRVTFAWTPRRDVASSLRFAALTFEGTTVHEAPVERPKGSASSDHARTSFEVAPGPLQISMTVTGATGRLLDTDVRYIDVPAFSGTRPVISSVDFIRPRSLPEFKALQQDPHALPTAAREFLRQDRLLLRVRAFAGTAPASVSVRLVNRAGHVLLELPFLGTIDDAAQFELPFATFAREDYRLEVRASGNGQFVTQLVPVRLAG